MNREKAKVVILCIVIGSVVLFLGAQNLKLRHDMKEMETLQMDLQRKVDSIGPTTEVFTVSASVFPGKKIEEADLQLQTLPASSVNETYIVDKSKLIGKFFKVSVSPGTSLTSDLVMAEKLEDNIYERDLALQFIPLGLKVGDYVDVRCVLPYGEEFIVLEHERVEAIQDNVIKLYLDESQLALYTSAMADRALYSNKGFKIYATKYIEPGLQKASPYYPVRVEMESVVNLNPNIKDKKKCINSSIRMAIETKLRAVLDQDGGSMAAGIAMEQAQLNQAQKLYIEGRGNNLTSVEPKKDPVVTAVEGAVEQQQNVQQNGIDAPPAQPTDAQGNTASVPEAAKDKSQGENLFDSEPTLE